MKALLFAVAFLATAAAGNAAECSPDNPEPFASFLQRFSMEPKFAVNRTVLPLRMLKWEYGLNDKGEDDSATVKSFVSKRDYLKWPTLDSYIKGNNLTSAIDSQTRTAAILNVLKQDTDWQMLYHFKSQKGCWFFWQYEDQSL